MDEDGFDDLYELFTWIEAGELVEAHNAWFERGVWTNICVPKLGWAPIPQRSWRCSAAKAAAHSLPRGLGDATEVLQLDIRKDEEGAAIMKKMVKPRQPLKSEWIAWGRAHAACRVCSAKGKVAGINPETGRKKMLPCGKCGGLGYDVAVKLPEMPILYHESRELLERLFAYCRIDVLAEEAISESLPDLSDEEVEVYLVDQGINERGFRLDESAIDAALLLVDEESADLNRELSALTEGEVTKVSQRAKLIAWFGRNGLDLPDTQASTIEGLLEAVASGSLRIAEVCVRALELLQAGSKSSTAKYLKMRDWVCPDARVHGGLLYHGASTGRWTGSGIQPHNFPRGSVKDQEYLWSLLKTGDRPTILGNAPKDKKTGEPVYTTVMEALSNGLRGVIVPSADHVLYVADFAAIEARVLLWLAGDEDGLDIFRRGEDIYCDFASKNLYRRLITKDDPEERGLGKVGILGLGYQMGASKFVDTALTMGGITIIEDVFCTRCEMPSAKHNWKCDHDFEGDTETMTAVRVVNAYRTRFWRVKEMWGAQESAAIRAVKTGRRVDEGYVSWEVEGGFLYCTLPSGRRIAYPEPRVVKRMMPWGQEKPSLTYMGINQYTRQWSRQNSYGGLLVENITQAVARDLMAGAILRAEYSGVYRPILSVHDELLAEGPAGRPIKEFEALMAATPAWAAGCPVEAEGWSGPRYRK